MNAVTMYKLVFRMVFMGIAGLAGLSLAMWGLNNSRLAALVLPKTLINSMYAEAAASAQPVVEKAALGTPTLPSASLSSLAKAYLRESPVSRPSPVSVAAAQSLPNLDLREQENILRVVVRFEPSEANLSEAELARVQDTLQKVKLNRNSKVRVITGQIPVTHAAGATPQTEKLRAQAVARLIFPYTQEVSIHIQQSPLENGGVVIEFVEVPAPASSGQKPS